MISPKAASLTALSKIAALAGGRERPARDAAAPAPRARVPGYRPKLILASSSPRRLALLEQVGLTPDALRPVAIDESASKGEVPRHYVRRIARAKCEAARKIVRDEAELAESFILSADTVVAVGRRIVLKAETEAEAIASLELLSGRNHRVHTCICLYTPDDRLRERIVETRVRFKRLSRDEITRYIASGEWRGKAGAYGVQGLAGGFVVKLIGSYTNVVGLPVTEVRQMLAGEGLDTTFLWTGKAEVETE
jgi:septum formation protein